MSKFGVTMIEFVIVACVVALVWNALAAII